MPFKDRLLGRIKTSSPPRYLTKDAVYDMGNIFPGSKPMRVLGDWSEDPNSILDDSQLRALHLALTNEFAIIQGPPGTGKVREIYSHVIG